MLAVTRGVGAFARDSVAATQQMKQVSALQFGSAVGGALRINQKRKRDAGLFAEETRVAEIAHADRREIRSTRIDFGLMLAQLRDVLAAENSSVVAKKDDHRRAVGPERAEAHSLSVGVRQDDFRELFADRCAR